MKKISLVMLVLFCCACSESAITNGPTPQPSEGVSFSKISFVQTTLTAYASMSYSQSVTADKKIIVSQGSKCTGSYELTDKQFEDIVNLVKAAGLDNFEQSGCKDNPEGSSMTGSSEFMNYTTSVGVTKQIGSGKVCEGVNEDELDNLKSYVNSIAKDVEVKCE